MWSQPVSQGARGRAILRPWPACPPSSQSLGQDSDQRLALQSQTRTWPCYLPHPNTGSPHPPAAGDPPGTPLRQVRSLSASAPRAPCDAPPALGDAPRASCDAPRAPCDAPLAHRCRATPGGHVGGACSAAGGQWGSQAGLSWRGGTLRGAPSASPDSHTGSSTLRPSLLGQAGAVLPKVRHGVAMAPGAWRCTGQGQAEAGPHSPVSVSRSRRRCGLAGPPWAAAAP